MNNSQNSAKDILRHGHFKEWTLGKGHVCENGNVSKANPF